MQRLDAGDVLRVDPAEQAREFRRHHRASGNGFAVQPIAVTHAGLDRMAERVAEVQQRTLALFGLVGRDDLGLVRA